MELGRKIGRGYSNVCHGHFVASRLEGLQDKDDPIEDDAKDPKTNDGSPATRRGKR